MPMLRSSLRPSVLGLALAAGTWGAAASAQATPDVAADTAQAVSAPLPEAIARRATPGQSERPAASRGTYRAAPLAPGASATDVSLRPRPAAAPAVSPAGSGAEADPSESPSFFDTRTAWGHKELPEGRPQFFDARIAWGHKDPAQRGQGLFDTEVAEGHKELPFRAIAQFEVPEEALALMDAQARHVRSLARTERLQARYFPAIERQLAALELPAELKYVALIESGLDPDAVSEAGARGIWQIMPETAGDFGLDSMAVHDPTKATPVAALYLDRLQRMFDGDWMLALAAYNAGPGRVMRAMRDYERIVGHAPTFWEVRHRLPRETQHYVPRFLATVRHFEAGA